MPAGGQMRSGAKVLLGAAVGVVVVVLLLLLSATANAPGDGNTPRTNRANLPTNQPVDPTPQPEPDPVPEPALDPLPGPLLSVTARVRVLLPDYSPAIGARVTTRALAARHDLPWHPEQPPRWDERGEATTDEQGRAEIELSLKTDSDGRRMLQASAAIEGWALCWSDAAIVSVHDHSPLLTITLQPLKALGIEVFASGQPVPGASVYLRAIPSDLPILAGITGDDGGWSGEAADDGRATFAVVYSPGFGAWEGEISEVRQRIDLPETGGLEGRVVDEAGKPVPFAHAIAVPASGTVTGDFFDTHAWPMTVADSRGRFLIEHLRSGPGEYSVTVAAAGSVPVDTSLLDVGDSGVADAGEIVLKRASGLSLQVKDSLGRPVSNALVRLSPGDAALSHWAMDRFSARTDSSGRVSFKSAWQGNWVVHVSATGYASYSAPLGTAREITIAPGGGLTGTMLDWQKQPAANALLVLIRTQDPRFGNWGKQADISQWHTDTLHPPVRVDEQGLFAFKDLPAGEYVLLAVDAEQRTTLVRDEVIVHPGAVIDLGPNTFAPRTDLLVRVRREGKPLGRVAFMGEAGEVMHTDEHGLLRLDYLKPGPILLRLESEALLRHDARFDARRVLAVQGELTEAILELPGAGFGALEGVISLAGQPQAGMLNLHGARARYHAVVSNDGRYGLPSVAAGSYEASVRFKDGLVVRFPLEVKEGANRFDLDEPLLRVRGRVSDVQGPFQVRAMSVDVPGTWVAAVSSGENEFEVLLPAGRWKVHALTPAYAGVAAIEVQPGTEGEVVVPIEHAGHVTVTVGKSLPADLVGKCTARLLCADGTPYPGEYQLNIAPGAVARFEGVVPGEYVLEVRGPALHYTRGIAVTAGETASLSIDLQSPATLEVELAGADAEAVAQASVRMQGVEGIVVTPPEGFGVPLQKGERTLLVRHIMPEVRQVVIEVPGFEPATVPIDFKPGAAIITRVALKKVP